jgi:hypothetical protein
MMRRAHAKRHGSRVVGTAHDDARRFDERLERARDVVEVAVYIEVVGFDIQRNGHGWGERQK